MTVQEHETLELLRFLINGFFGMSILGVMLFSGAFIVWAGKFVYRRLK